MNSSQNLPVSFTDAIVICFSKYFDFTGRAPRSEYWWFYLFTVLLSWLSALVDSEGIIIIILTLIFLFPSLAAGARRLHDINKSGWWQLLMLTIIGIIPLIIWWASVGKKEPNKYGPPIY